MASSSSDEKKADEAINVSVLRLGGDTIFTKSLQPGSVSDSEYTVGSLVKDVVRDCESKLKDSGYSDAVLKAVKEIPKKKHMNVNASVFIDPVLGESGASVSMA